MKAHRICFLLSNFRHFNISKFCLFHTNSSGKFVFGCAVILLDPFELRFYLDLSLCISLRLIYIQLLAILLYFILDSLKQRVLAREISSSYSYEHNALHISYGSMLFGQILHYIINRDGIWMSTKCNSLFCFSLGWSQHSPGFSGIVILFNPAIYFICLSQAKNLYI